MITPQELRIGNLFMDSKDRLCHVEQISIEVGDTKIRSLNYSITSMPIRPIPLTEEWLDKLGFVKTVSNLGRSISIDYVDFRMPGFVCFLLDNNKGLEVEYYSKHSVIDDRQYICAVNYIHQLQNVYFALTGNELSIK